MPRAMLNADFIEFLWVRLEARWIFRDGVLKRFPVDTPKRLDRIQFSLT